jgi:hypothetical protein
MSSPLSVFAECRRCLVCSAGNAARRTNSQCMRFPPAFIFTIAWLLQVQNNNKKK